MSRKKQLLDALVKLAATTHPYQIGSAEFVAAVGGNTSDIWREWGSFDNLRDAAVRRIGRVNLMPLKAGQKVFGNPAKTASYRRDDIHEAALRAVRKLRKHYSVLTREDVASEAQCSTGYVSLYGGKMPEVRDGLRTLARRRGILAELDRMPLRSRGAA